MKKLKREDIQGVYIDTIPTEPSNFTITVRIDEASRFVLIPADVVDAVKEYTIKYQKELMEDGRYYEINI